MSEKREKEKTAREIMADSSYEVKKQELLREINDRRIYNPDPTDFSVFIHSPEEKNKIWEMKKSNYEDRKKFYGADAHKYLNIPKFQIHSHKTF